MIRLKGVFLMESEELVTKESQAEGGVKNRGLLIFYAAFVFAASYLFLCLVPISSSPLGFLVLSFAVYASTLAVSLMLGGRLRLAGILAFVFGIGVAAYRFIHGAFGMDFFTKGIFPSFTLCGLSYAFFVVTLFGNDSGSLGGSFLLDLCKGVAYLFASFADIFTTVFGKGKDRRRSSVTAVIIFGIIIAAVLLLAVGSLLSFDEHFTAMLPRIELESIPNIILKLFFSVPLSAMLFSLVASSAEKKLPGLSSDASREGIASALRFIPAPLLLIPAAAVLVLYAMFFISQWGYYVSAFTHELPSGYSAAEYARNGFFELLAVACVNAALLIGIGCFTKRGGRGEMCAVKLISALVCAATLVLVATALSKMLLYIDLYDLTASRLRATVFLVFLAFAFIIGFLAVLIPQMKAMPYIIACGLALTLAFCLVNTERMIANYNVRAYLNGKHESIDIEYLRDDLGVNALDALDSLREEAEDGEVSAKALEAAAGIRSGIRNGEAKWYEYDAPYIRELRRAGKARPDK